MCRLDWCRLSWMTVRPGCAAIFPKRLVLGLRKNFAVDGQMREKCFELGLSQFHRMPLLAAHAMETKELNNPMSAGLLGRYGIMQRAHLVAKLIKQLLAFAVQLAGRLMRQPGHTGRLRP